MCIRDRFLDRARGRGIFYVINGQGAPDSEHHGRYSGMYEWEERPVSYTHLDVYKRQMRASVPLGITVFLLFTSFNFATDGVKIFYYAILNIFFWMFFTMCDIPHITLGQELTEDYDEKSSIRGYSSAFLYAGELVVSGATMILVNRCSTEVVGWRVVAIITALFCFLSYFVAGACTKGKEIALSDEQAKAANTCLLYTS